MKAWTSLRTSKSWKDAKKPLADILHGLSHIGSALPLLVGLWDFWQGNLGANPILEITHRSGKTAITLLIISLAVSPLKQLLNWGQLNKLRSCAYNMQQFHNWKRVPIFFNFFVLSATIGSPPRLFDRRLCRPIKEAPHRVFQIQTGCGPPLF